MTGRHLIIGAGYAGNGVANSFADAGVPYDHVERNSYIGGNWADGVYDSTQIISSRDSTQYSDYPMPRSYPDFPSREQVLAYLNDYVDHFGLRDRIEFETEVVRCRPLNDDGTAGWRVELASGEVRDYAGVVVANGHHWDRRYPEYPGEFSGHTIHSKDYKRPEDLEGERVLVVGAGNSGCDIAVEAARELGGAEISMRRGYWFLPKTILGVPTAELDRPWFPVWAQRLFLRAMLRIVYGRPERYGLPRPDHRLFDSIPPSTRSSSTPFATAGFAPARTSAGSMAARSTSRTARAPTSTQSCGPPAFTSASRSSTATCSSGAAAPRSGWEGCSPPGSPACTCSASSSPAAAPGP